MSCLLKPLFLSVYNPEPGPASTYFLVSALEQHKHWLRRLYRRPVRAVKSILRLPSRFLAFATMKCPCATDPAILLSFRLYSKPSLPLRQIPTWLRRCRRMLTWSKYPLWCIGCEVCSRIKRFIHTETFPSANCTIALIWRVHYIVQIYEGSF